jgi:VWFA-related protein
MKFYKMLLRCSAAACVCLALAGAGLPALSQETQQKNAYTFSSHVDLVNVDVTVVDKRGGFVSGLSKENFEILEDGVPQQINTSHHEDIPVTIGIVVDNSGSMTAKKDHIVAAAIGFVQASKPEDEVFVVNFNDDVYVSPNTSEGFTNDVGALRLAFSQVDTVGQTALYDAVVFALRHLGKGNHRKKALLVVSDGDDNASLSPKDKMLELARQSGATIYTVALYDEGQGHYNTSLMKKLARVSGGQFYNPSSPDKVWNICQRVAKDIRERYTLLYTSSNLKRDGQWRKLSVRAVAPGRKLKVVAREGYFAPGGPAAKAENN